MNVVVRELATKSTLQEFLVTLLEDVEKYFRAQAPMSEEKAVSTFTLIFGKVQREFPLITSIGNINKRLAKDLRDKIADRIKTKEKRKATHLKSFIEGIKGEEEDLNRSNSEQNQQNIQAWVKKMVIETIQQLKEDIKEADDNTAQTLAAKLSRIVPQGSELPQLLFADSLLTNWSAVSTLQGYNIKKVVADPKAANQINLFEGAKALRKTRLLVLSADAILRNGGLLCSSGSLMLAIAAKQLGVPVIAVSRSYCLWQHLICNQESLVVSESARSWFPEEDQLSFRVVVGKRFDYIPPQLITTMVGQSRGWDNKSIVEIFQEYYH